MKYIRKKKRPIYSREELSEITESELSLTFREVEMVEIQCKQMYRNFYCLLIYLVFGYVVGLFSLVSSIALACVIGLLCGIIALQFWWMSLMQYRAFCERLSYYEAERIKSLRSTKAFREARHFASRLYSKDSKTLDRCRSAWILAHEQAGMVDDELSLKNFVQTGG